MSKKIKLIWEFRGPFAAKTATHHEIHLKEYITTRNLTLKITGTESYNENITIAYIVVKESEMIAVRDELKPQRGELYDDPFN